MAEPLARYLPDDAIWHASPNVDARAGGDPDVLLIHFTNMATAEAAVGRLCCPQARVSCHYVISEQGQVWQLVSEEERAWHAGLGGWGGVGADMNSRCVGIELANTGSVPFPEPQMRVLERMAAGIMARWGIGPERVIGHSDMAPDRKDDPGPRFDWRRLALQGLAVWPEVSAPEEDLGAFRALAEAVGYRPEFSDEDVLKAVRLRFRPWARGALDGWDIAVLRDIATRFPVDRRITGA